MDSLTAFFVAGSRDTLPIPRERSPLVGAVSEAQSTCRETRQAALAGSHQQALVVARLWTWPGLGVVGNPEGDVSVQQGWRGQGVKRSVRAGGAGPGKAPVTSQVSTQPDGSPGTAWQQPGPQVDGGHRGTAGTGGRAARRVPSAEATPCRGQPRVGLSYWPWGARWVLEGSLWMDRGRLKAEAREEAQALLIRQATAPSPGSGRGG